MPKRKSVLPKFCYSKAFWILIGILVPSVLSSVSAIYAQLEAMDERIRANEVMIATNNVPQLKEYIGHEFDEVNMKIDRNTNLLQDNYKLLCKLSQGEC